MSRTDGRILLGLIVFAGAGGAWVWVGALILAGVVVSWIGTTHHS